MYKGLCSDPYEDLANAIIVQAVSDYRTALKAIKKDRRAPGRKTVRECENFFRSKWFGVLTSVDPEYLMRKIREEI